LLLNLTFLLPNLNLNFYSICFIQFKHNIMQYHNIKILKCQYTIPMFYYTVLHCTDVLSIYTYLLQYFHFHNDYNFQQKCTYSFLYYFLLLLMRKAIHYIIISSCTHVGRYCKIMFFVITWRRVYSTASITWLLNY